MGYQGVTDVEYWRPSFAPGRGRGGRPRVRVVRTMETHPPPTPQRTPCRLWQGAVDGDGYGVMADSHLRPGYKKYVHRWVWEMAYGRPKPFKVVRHKCDNRACFRLSHLEIGSVADNNRDAQERGHLGQVRAMPPSEVRAIMARKATGEIWTSIAADYPQYSLATVKRAKDYINDLDE
jgi:hypothetical protein